MLHDGGQRHREGLCEFADGDVAASFEFGQQRAPRRIGDGGKDSVEVVGQIVNHLVKYRRADDRVKRKQEMELRGYFAVAAWISFTASSLAHSAGPAMVPISQPAPSTSTDVGMPSARPALFRS